MEAAFFDFDGTLFRGSTWRGIVWHHRTTGTNKTLLQFYLYFHLSLYPLYRVGLLKRKSYYMMWAKNMSWTLKGLTLDQAERTFQWLWENYVRLRLRPEILSLWEKHRGEGRMLVIASGSFEPLIKLVGDKLGADGVIGTELEVKNGKLTGRIKGPLCFGEGKAEKVKAFLTLHPSIDLSRSYAYSDSFHDLPFLELVGHPVAVYPDPELASYAQTKGWPIIGSKPAP
ncbi:MAG: HAD family hydrolase [Anaerolineae bacterium]|nr:HAD-IB family hydrolase [Anaerolineae bacterium]MDW8102112.1 HAD family hydrolase [Anaerolineae bacterium]